MNVCPATSAVALTDPTSAAGEVVDSHEPVVSGNPAARRSNCSLLISFCEGRGCLQ
jgi:hypothetical protein